MQISNELLNEILEGTEGVIPGPWRDGPTPSYLSMGQVYNGQDPITIRSPAHTEEIATVWTCLLPTEKNAAHIARCDPDTIRAIVTELLELREA